MHKIAALVVSSRIASQKKKDRTNSDFHRSVPLAYDLKVYLYSARNSAHALTPVICETFKKRDDANRYLLTLVLASCGQPHHCKNQPASLRSDALPTSLESSAHITRIGRRAWRVVKRARHFDTSTRM